MSIIDRNIGEFPMV